MMNTVQISEVEFKETQLKTYADQKRSSIWEIQRQIEHLLTKETQKNLNDQEVMQLQWMRELFTMDVSAWVNYSVELYVPDPTVGVNCNYDDIRSYLDGNKEPEFEFGCDYGTPNGIGYIDGDDLSSDAEICGHDGEPEGFGVHVHITGVKEGVVIPPAVGVNELRTALNEFCTAHPGLLRQMTREDLLAVIAEFN